MLLNLDKFSYKIDLEPYLIIGIFVKLYLKSIKFRTPLINLLNTHSDISLTTHMKKFFVTLDLGKQFQWINNH